jgi:cytochrome c-type biogenesis protein CcmH/NrfF
VASLEERFGDQVLGAPKNQGFGRLAWLGPIIILIVGLGIIWVYLRRYLARPSDDRSEPAPAGADPADERTARIARIEEELKGHRS